MTLFRLLLGVCLLCILTANSLGGYYAVTYSTANGTTTVNWTSGGVTLTSGYNPANSGGASVAPTGSVQNTGTITATFNWVPNPTIPNDQPPAFVVAYKSASATWTGDSGACSDGLGDSEVDSQTHSSSSGPNQGVSSGTHYLLINNPGRTFSFSNNPNSTSHGNIVNGAIAKPHPNQSTGPTTTGNYYPTGRISAYVSFTAGVWTPAIAMTNITKGSDGSWNIQVGQPTTATLYWTDSNGTQLASLPHPLTITQYTWNVQGTVFSSWSTSLNYATLLPFQNSGQTSQSWTWEDGGSQGEAGRTAASPIVEVEIYTDDGISIGYGYFNSESVYVWRPYPQFAGTKIDEAMYDSTPTPSQVSASAEIDFNMGVSDVFGTYIGQTGAGGVNWCQLVRMSDLSNYGAFSKSDNTSDQYLVDVNGDSVDWYWLINPDGSPRNAPCVVDQNWPTSPYDQFEDVPAWSLQWYSAEADSWSVDYDFENWTMFQPNGGVFVPITYQTWSWADAGGPPYSNPAGPKPAFGTYDDAAETFPTWTGNHDSH